MSDTPIVDDPQQAPATGAVGAESASDPIGFDERGGLTDEIVSRWDPSRLLKLVSKQAGTGRNLDLATRRYFEDRIGADFGGVRVYTGPYAESVTKAHSAEALTVGGTGMILMGQTGNRSMATSSGRALLAHELTHVAQQSRGIHRSAYGGGTPLATEENEIEAEAAEEAELIEAAGGAGDEPDSDEKRGQLLEKLFARLIDVFEDEERVYEQRNGLPRYRS